MGYKVIYPQLGKGRHRRFRKLPKKTRIAFAGFAVLGAAFLWAFWQQGLTWLLPGDPVVTENALQAMIDNLRDGEDLGSAVATFCREVVAGAR